MRISRILETKGDAVATISADAPVAEALAELARLGIGSLVVSEDGVSVNGIVSERDVVRELNVAGAEMMAQPVSSIMSHAVRSCSPEDGIDKIMGLMTDLRVRHLPVVVDGRMIGIVSIGDVVKARIDELERESRELHEYIGAR